jgi:BlaI family transcriptional regulator, penicillinase repressor
MKPPKRPALSPLENLVMGVVWARHRATADEVRAEMSRRRPLKDSTIRTVLRRLEEKGYLTHVVEGRTYVYAPRIDSSRAAADAVRGIIERFCEGSVEALLVGMVADELLPADKLRELADRIDAMERGQTSFSRKKGKSR